MIYRGKSTIAIPPGETIIEMMDDRKIARSELAPRMNMSEQQLNRLLDGKVPVTPQISSKLEKVFGIPAYFWLNLEAIYRKDIAKIARESHSRHNPSISVGI